MEAIQIPPKLVINKKAKAKERGICITFKIGKLSLNRLFSRGIAVYGSVRILSKASGLSEKK